MSTADFEPDHDAAERFLDLLEPNGTFWFQTAAEALDSRAHASNFSGKLSELWERLVDMNLNGAAIWVQINAGTGRKDSDVTDVRAYFVDLDGADASELLSESAHTDILVESSRGKYHGYWLAGGVPLDQFKQRQLALAARFGGDTTVCNLGRVMRLPGLYHHKATPFRTRLIKPSVGEPK
jgi:hypothetical protein